MNSKHSKKQKRWDFFPSQCPRRGICQSYYAREIPKISSFSWGQRVNRDIFGKKFRMMDCHFVFTYLLNTNSLKAELGKLHRWGNFSHWFLKILAEPIKICHLWQISEWGLLTHIQCISDRSPMSLTACFPIYGRFCIWQRLHPRNTCYSVRNIRKKMNGTWMYIMYTLCCNCTLVQTEIDEWHLYLIN